MLYYFYYFFMFQLTETLEGEILTSRENTVTDSSNNMQSPITFDLGTLICVSLLDIVCLINKQIKTLRNPL